MLKPKKFKSGKVNPQVDLTKKFKFIFRSFIASLDQSVRWNENTSKIYSLHVLDKDRKSLLSIPLNTNKFTLLIDITRNLILINIV